MEQDLDGLENLIIQEVFKDLAIIGLSDPVFSFLPESVWNVIVSEALAVEHDRLEEVTHAYLDLPRASSEPARRIFFFTSWHDDSHST